MDLYSRKHFGRAYTPEWRVTGSSGKVPKGAVRSTAGLLLDLEACHNADSSDEICACDPGENVAKIYANLHAIPILSLSSPLMSSPSLLFVFYCLAGIGLLLRLLWSRFIAYKHAGSGCSLIAVDPSHHTGFLWPNPQRGKIGTMVEKFDPYIKAGRLLLPAVSLVTPRTIVFVADPEVIKTVATDKSGTFQKDPQTYSVLHTYGVNIVGSDGAVWKKQKDVSRAAFSEGNVVLAWKESCKASRQYLDGLAIQCKLGPLDVTEFLKKVTLASISASVFGRRIPYGKEATANLPSGYELQFGEALQTACEHMVARWITPSWAYKLPIPLLQRFLSHVHLAYHELERHLRGLISESRIRGKEETCLQDDLLRRLVQSNALEVDPEKRLTDAELLSNVFIFLVAGHETTAHTMSFILGHLALYPAVQEKLFEELRSIWPETEDIVQAEESFPDLSRFVSDFLNLSQTLPAEYWSKEYTTAVFRESLRHFPVAPRLPKTVLKDTVLHSRSRYTAGPGSKQESVAVPKGGLVVMDIMATHFNTAYWGEDAKDFRPERFIDTPEYRWPREAFLPFSLGTRVCIGQRAGYVQTIAILAHIIRQYQVSLPPHLQGLPFQQQRSTLLRFWLGASLSPTDIRLAFTLREERL
ncbi:cytochrome P450 [Ramaria rubella]|nr:cytochrome P450 [Ramaria rubella]